MPFSVELLLILHYCQLMLNLLLVCHTPDPHVVSGPLSLLCAKLSLFISFPKRGEQRFNRRQNHWFISNGLDMGLLLTLTHRLEVLWMPDWLHTLVPNLMRLLLQTNTLIQQAFPLYPLRLEVIRTLVLHRYENAFIYLLNCLLYSLAGLLVQLLFTFCQQLFLVQGLYGHSTCFNKFGDGALSYFLLLFLAKIWNACMLLDDFFQITFQLSGVLRLGLGFNSRWRLEVFLSTLGLELNHMFVVLACVTFIYGWLFFFFLKLPMKSVDLVFMLT